MFCANCGNKLPDQSKFCPKCGKPVDQKTGTSVSRSGSSGDERPYNPDAWKKFGYGGYRDKKKNGSKASASRSSSSADERPYNPDACREYRYSGYRDGKKKKDANDTAKQPCGTLYAGRVLVPLAFVLLIISCTVPALIYGAGVYGYRYFRAPGMMHSWFFYILHALITEDNFNNSFWVIIVLIAAVVILPVFFVKSNRRGSGWIVFGCVLLWILFFWWILCAVQLNSTVLASSYTLGVGVYLLGIAAVLDTVGAALYKHQPQQQKAAGSAQKNGTSSSSNTGRQVSHSNFKGQENGNVAQDDKSMVPTAIAIAEAFVMVIAAAIIALVISLSK